jgi:hypothetical protein
MDVIALCSLPVGIVRWRSGNALTVVVKATVVIDRDGEARLAEVQEPLHPDVPYPGSEIGELQRASDFAPVKARADIQIVGHARPGSPSARVEARISAGAWAKRFLVVAPAPDTAIPLLAASLRGHDGRPERVAPVAPSSPERAALAGAGGLDAEGFPLPSARRVAFDFHNASPRDQQIDAIAPDLLLTIEGLLPSGPRRVRLPGVEPRVLAAWGGDAMEAVELSCDTLLIDLDWEICSLTWRGRIPSAPPQNEPTELVVALSSRSAKVTWSRVLAELDTATRTRAVEPPLSRGRSQISLGRGLQLGDPLGPVPARAAPVTPHDDEEPPTQRPAQIRRAHAGWDDLDEPTSAMSGLRGAAWEDAGRTPAAPDPLDDEPTASIGSYSLDDAPTAFSAPATRRSPPRSSPHRRCRPR